MLRKILCFVLGVVVSMAVWLVFCAIADYILVLKADQWRMMCGWAGGYLAIFLGRKSEQLFQEEQESVREHRPSAYERGYSAGKKDAEHNGGWEREPFKYG